MIPAKPPKWVVWTVINSFKIGGDIVSVFFRETGSFLEFCEYCLYVTRRFIGKKFTHQDRVRAVREFVNSDEYLDAKKPEGLERQLVSYWENDILHA